MPNVERGKATDGVAEALLLAAAVLLALTAQFGALAVQAIMQFPVQRDDRRRRVLKEEPTGGEAAGEPEAPRPRRSDRTRLRRYGESALREGQPRITDLAPRRVSTLVLLLLGGVLLIAGLEALHYYLPLLSQKLSHTRLASLDLGEKGSLGVWLSSTLLTAASLAALLVYFVRRHRMDDYHGGYRIWIVAAICWLGMSIDQTARLHDVFKDAMTRLTGQSLAGDGWLWWVGAYLLVAGGVGIRLLLEMRAHKASTALLVLSGAGFSAWVVARTGWLAPSSEMLRAMLAEGGKLSGDLLLFISMLAHARYVVLDAGGKLSGREAAPKKKKRKPVAAAETEPEQSEKSESKPAATITAKRNVEPARPAVGKPAATGPITTSSGNKLRIDPPETAADRSKLSKADRKALRRAQQEDRGERYR